MGDQRSRRGMLWGAQARVAGALRGRRRRGALGLWACLFTLLVFARAARADRAGEADEAQGIAQSSGAPAPVADAGAPDAGPVSPDARELRRKAALVTQLLRDELPADVDAEDLFELPLGSTAAQFRVEVRRLELLLARARAFDAHVPAARAAGAGAGAGSTPGEASAGAEPAGPPASEPARPTVPYGELRRQDRALWRARLELDQARLAFLRLPGERRAALLAAHADRRRTVHERDREQQIDDAEAEARHAEEQKRLALEAAKRARSEAVRLIHEEYARLLSVTQAQAELEGEQIARRTRLEERSEALLGWRRRVSELTATAGPAKDGGARADAAYADLRRTLVQARSDLADALGGMGDGADKVPRAGQSRLGALPAEADAAVALEQLAKVNDKAAALTKVEEELEARRADQLMVEVETLNRLRLELLDELSNRRRGDVLGFGPTGWGQAGSEVRQVILTLRYHLYAAYRWFAGIVSGTGRGESAWVFFVLTFKWMLPVGAFWWWRRRADSVIASLRRRLRGMRMSGSRGGASLVDARLGEQALDVAERVRRPLEWLLLVGSISWLIPDSMRSLLEVRVLSSVLLWVFGGLFIVLSIDALSSHRPRPMRSHSAHDTSVIRFRSLKLVGRATVVVGLLLSLTDLLVGKGTIYSWVFSTCWFAAVPLLLVIVSWWRPFIFRRFAQMRKPNAFDRWVLSRRDEPANTAQSVISSLAAVAGGVYLFALGVARVVRGRVLTFNLTRRLLAYLFRRDMSRKAQEASVPDYQSLSPEAYRALGPEMASTEHVKSVADSQVDDVIERIRAEGGGVIALVGERGSGKSTLLSRIAARSEDVLAVSCSPLGAAPLRAALNRAAERDPASDLRDTAAALDGSGRDMGLLIDNAHHLVHSSMGGLDELDSMLDLCRNFSQRCTWVLAFDAVIWRLVERMRGTRPLFDDVIRLRSWSEEGIVRLLVHRSEVAGIDPDFSGLALDLPADADEYDRQEAVRNTEANYYRLLWDYASGNPGVALHFWRRSLGVDAAGVVRVRLFDAPGAQDLDELPDEAVFVLRAIIQLGWASVDEIRGVTSLSLSEVQDAVRYGGQRGYFDRADDRYCIHWDWFRAITRFLQRRHLLAVVS